MEISKRNWLLLAAALLILFILFIGSRVSLKIEAELLALPILAFYSFYRMLFAYVAAFLFSLIYGYYAASNKAAGKVLIPILDILQSVPILGFFPAAVFIFVSAFQGNVIGIELASIFLIFTSMAWNMTFGVYESISTIPKNIVDAVKSFGLKRFLLFKNLILPATIPKLVYNSMISWAGGWYFLIASEIISLGSETHGLPGIGSYLLATTSKGQILESLLGLLVLMVIIVTMDLLIWRPLTVWADKFKYESGKTERPKSRVYSFYKWSPAMVSARKLLSKGYDIFLDDLELIAEWVERKNKANRIYAQVFKGMKFAALGIFAYLLLRGTWILLSLAFSIITEPIPPEAYQIPAALLLSFLRLIAAFLFSLLWTVPAAIIIMRSPKYRRYFVPFFEIAAAIPAPALFPIMILLTLSLTGSLEIASILLITTGMQWYLLFNAMAGVKSLPNDLDEAVASMGVKGDLYFKRVMLPVMLPSLVTGSIIAFGGGWNALVVAEYVKFSGCAGGVCSVYGIGSFISNATYSTALTPDVQAKLLFLSLFAMVGTIFLINHLIWRRVYNHVLKKYRLEF